MTHMNTTAHYVDINVSTDTFTDMMFTFLGRAGLLREVGIGTWEATSAGEAWMRHLVTEHDSSKGEQEAQARLLREAALVLMTEAGRRESSK